MRRVLGSKNRPDCAGKMHPLDGGRTTYPGNRPNAGSRYSMAVWRGRLLLFRVPGHRVDDPIWSLFRLACRQRFQCLHLRRRGLEWGGWLDTEHQKKKKGGWRGGDRMVGRSTVCTPWLTV